MTMSMSTGSSVTVDGDSELSVATILESIPDAVIIAEYASSEIVAANDAAGELFECPTENLLGLGHLELHPAEDADLYSEAFGRGFENEQVDRLQDGSPLYVETTTGDRKPVEINAQRIQVGERTFVLGVFRDISSRIDRERQLEQTTTRLNTLLDSAPLPVAVLDRRGRVQMWNQAAEETFGYSSEEIIGDYYPLLVEMNQLNELLGDVLDGNVLDGYETVLRAQDGSRVQVELYARPLYEDGEVTGVIGSAVDLTDQKRRRQRLDVLHRLLRHNVRNKLVLVQQYASMLSDGASPDGVTVEEAGEKIFAAAEELAELSNHATQVRKAVNTTETGFSDVSELLETVDELEPDDPEATFETPPAHEQGCIPSLANEALSWLLRYITGYVDEPAIQLAVTVHDKYVQVDVHGEDSLLSDGDAELITNGQETALRHGSGMDIARSYLTLTSIGGDIIQHEDSPLKRSFSVEIPRTDTCEPA
jgi:PAS domain S-box-containing protein